jgi:hypothetical protein
MKLPPQDLQRLVAILGDQMGHLDEGFTGQVTAVLHIKNGAVAIIEYAPAVRIPFSPPQPLDRAANLGLRKR